MDVSIQQIRAFATVARLKSFTRAAALLSVAQPTLTVQIRHLEEALATRLFDRNSRSVELTRLGRDLLPSVERLLQDFDAMLSGVRDQVAQRRGIVKIAALPSAAVGILPGAIRTFREHYPGADFLLKDVVAGRVLALVREEAVDLGIIGGNADHPDVERLFKTNDSMHVVCAREHPIAKARSVTPAVLARYPLIMMDPETSVRKVVDEAFHAAGLMANPVCEVTYMMTAIGLVQARLGIAILPASAREIQIDPNLCSRPIKGSHFVREISLIKKRKRSLPPLSASFADYLVSRLSAKDAETEKYHAKTQRRKGSEYAA
jgi:DNA-binding transcriptional LysR family regulator